MIYKLMNSLLIKEVGHYPQCENALWNGPRFDNDSFAFNGKFGPLKGNPALPQPILHKKANLTDYLSAMDNNRYLTISPSLYGFLKPFLNTHQTWDIKVSNDVYKFDRGKSEYLFKAGAKQKLHDYKILHISYPNRNFINFEKSVFFTDIKDNYLKNINMEGISESYIDNPTHKKIEITSDNDYRSLIEKMKHIKPKSVVIPRKIVCNLNYNKDEIFRLITPINNMSGYYVSAELKKKIEEIGFTGMEFKLLKNLNPSIKVEV